MMTACVLLIGFGIHLSGQQVEGGSQAARVVVTGKGTGFMKYSSRDVQVGPDGKPVPKVVEYTLTLYDLGAGQKLVVWLPPAARPAGSAASGGADPDLQRVLGQLVDKSLTAVEGTLTSSENPQVLAFAGASGVKRIPILKVTRETKLTDGNRQNFPPEHGVRVQGVLVKEATTIGGMKFAWGVRDHGGVLPLEFAEGVKPPTHGTKVVATGRAAVRDGQLVVTVTGVSAAK